MLAIALFAVSVFFYSYQASATEDVAALSLNLAATYPYRGYALMFVGTGSFFMVTASISYSRRSKNIL